MVPCGVGLAGLAPRAAFRLKAPLETIFSFWARFSLRARLDTDWLWGGKRAVSLAQDVFDPDWGSDLMLSRVDPE